MGKKIIVIGSGFSGLAAATCLAQKGHQVTLLEKNSTPGGRARKFETDGFAFDMGPSWYWMPDVFEQYFALFGKKPSDYYELVRLDPSYQIIFGKEDLMRVPAQMKELEAMFERYEPGSSENLRKFLHEAAYKYEVGINEFVFKPSKSILEFADLRVLKSVFRLQMLTSMAKHVDRLFKNDQLRQLLKFPVLFLGATPENTPAMYSLMNYADLALGTWYPMGGMHKIIEGMVELARQQGVHFKFDTEVTRIEVNEGSATRVHASDRSFAADAVVCGADYHHVEQHLLDAPYRKYDEAYWDRRTMAPSSLLFYLGIDKKIPGLKHHNLFFDADFKEHAKEIYEDPKWPNDPLFYVCAPSVTDPSVAPEGKENIFLLMPLAPDLHDDDARREQYYDLMMDRLEAHLGTSVREHVVYKRSYAHRDFKQDYHAYKGNAYGLANVLQQTAFLKPAMHSKVKNILFTGQLTVPGPGVPPSLISGQVVATEVDKLFGRKASPAPRPVQTVE